MTSERISATNTAALDAEQILGRDRRLVEAAHRAALAQLAEPVRRVAEYHVGWREADGTVGGR
ncbi:hypothetical protein ACFQ08_37710, partial [Streptosporangium algeriense]